MLRTTLPLLLLLLFAPGVGRAADAPTQPAPTPTPAPTPAPIPTPPPSSTSPAGPPSTPPSTSPPAWHPQSKNAGNFDWVQTTSGEWIKGELIAMYDEELEFDSEEFEELTLDWEDVAEIHSAQVMNVGLLGRRQAVGLLHVLGERVTVTSGVAIQEYKRWEVLTITAGEPKEANYWSMKVYTGILLRTGNSSVRETNLQANVKRRTVRDRISLDAVGNQNVTDDETIANNHRASTKWDKFISDRFFAQPIFAEYFRDPFQNIDRKMTVGVGAGYQLIDSKTIEWNFSGGPGYQETKYSEVEAGQPERQSTPAVVVLTDAEWDITKNIDFDGSYRMQLVDEASGRYTHHMLLSFETDITKRIDLDVSWIWDRVQLPQPRADGTVPAKDDFRTTVGLTFEF